MVTAVSKLLLVVALLGSFVNAASNRNGASRGLSFLHPHVSDSHSYDEAESEEESIDHYYSKIGKSGGKGLKSEGGKGMKSDKKKSDKESGKGMKSDKKEKSLHAADGDEVVYEVVVGHHRSSKSNKAVPDFEYIEIGYKSAKAGKTSYYGSDGKYAKDAKSGSKTPKAPTAPTMAPGPTVSPRPTEVGSFGVGVPFYSLAYNTISKNEPTTEEMNELETATSAYLSDFFFDEFNEDDFTIYEEFITDVVDSTASKNMPVVVDYRSVARFDQLSMITPTSMQLGSAVEEAFTGLDMIQYEDWLKEMLPSSNVFVGSKVQFYQGQAVPDTVRFGIGVTGIAASAVAFTLLVAGAVLLKKSKPDGRKGSGSGNDKLNKAPPSDVTVAGETYAGETYDGTASVSARSMDYAGRYNDEEEGTKIKNLGSIPESHDSDSDAEENGDRSQIFRRGIVPRKILNAFRGSVKSAPKTASFENVALQAPTSGSRYQDHVMSDPSSSEDDASQMSDSELSQFVAEQVNNENSGGHRLEIKSLLSQDSNDENSGDLSVRDNSSRRLRTVAEIEAMLSSELKGDNDIPGSKTSGSNIEVQLQTSRPRTVEEIESLLTMDDDESILEYPYSSDEDVSIEEC